MISHGISSAPVYNKELQEYAGMLDYRDIVDYVLTVFHKKHLQPISEDEAIGISDIVHKATAGETVPTEAIVGIAAFPGHSLLHVLCGGRPVEKESLLLGHGPFQSRGGH